MRHRIAAWLVDAFVPFFFPKVNPIVRRLLRSRIHWIASWYLLMLCIEGRRSGRAYEIPLVYRRDRQGRLESLTSRNGLWWRNLRGLSEVTVTHRGQSRRAKVELIDHDVKTLEEALGRRDICRRVLTPLPAEHAVLIRLESRDK